MYRFCRASLSMNYRSWSVSLVLLGNLVAEEFRVGTYPGGSRIRVGLVQRACKTLRCEAHRSMNTKPIHPQFPEMLRPSTWCL